MHPSTERVNICHICTFALLIRDIVVNIYLSVYISFYLCLCVSLCLYLTWSVQLLSTTAAASARCSSFNIYK